MITPEDLAAIAADFEEALGDTGSTCTIERNTPTKDATKSLVDNWATVDSGVPCWFTSVALAGGLQDNTKVADERSTLTWYWLSVPTDTDAQPGDRITLDDTSPARRLTVRSVPRGETLASLLQLVVVEFVDHV